MSYVAKAMTQTALACAGGVVFLLVCLLLLVSAFHGYVSERKPETP